MLENSNPGVKKASIALLVTLRRSSLAADSRGVLAADVRSMLAGIKPALLATIEEAFAKVSDEDVR